jgi:dihydrofolate reductase
MTISLIAAVDKNSGIGFKNKLLTTSKEDFEWFREHTLDKLIVMGRSTYESIGKPLPNRYNMVLSKDNSYDPHEDVYVVNNINYIINNHNPDEEVMVIGGEQVYKQFLPYADKLYLTHINKEFEADAYFPEVIAKDWLLTYMRQGENQKFCIYNRR